MTLLASDEDLEVRRQAATALGSIGERSALSALERAARDSDPYLVQAALASIKILQSSK
jgi:HEAT repeat protein